MIMVVVFLDAVIGGSGGVKQIKSTYYTPIPYIPKITQIHRTPIRDPNIESFDHLLIIEQEERENIFHIEEEK